MRLLARLTARPAGHSNRRSTIRSRCLITLIRVVASRPARSHGATHWVGSSPLVWFNCSLGVLREHCPCVVCLPVVWAPGTRRSIVLSPSTCSWLGTNCQSFIFLILQVPSLRVRAYLQQHNKPLKAEHASHW